MAVTMPKVEIRFKQLASTLIERSERGIAILIIKDDTDDTFDIIKYKDATEAEADKDKFTPENLKYIKDVLNFKATQCYVVRIGTEGTLNNALKVVTKNAKTGWITIANGTNEEFSDLKSWIVSKEKDGFTYKAVVYNVNSPDCKHLVNFVNEKVVFSDDRGEQAGDKYCPSLIGLLAGCNVERGSTNYICSNLKNVEEVEDNDEAVGKGKFILVNDDDIVKVGLGINSMTTMDGINNTEDMKYIDTVETMDLIADDISTVFKEEYQGHYKNNYDNQILFISAINSYFKELANDYILDNQYDNVADVDVETQRNAWLGVGKTEAAEWDEQTVKNRAFKRTVYLLGDIKILGAMENLKFTVSLF